VKYLSDYRPLLGFENGTRRCVDLWPHLEGEVFEPLRDLDYFQQVRLNTEIDTITWPNDADFSPDFLYEIGQETGRQAEAI
jgi:hypothetical protein